MFSCYAVTHMSWIL